MFQGFQLLISVFLSTDCSTVQNPAPPPPFLPLNFDDIKNIEFICSVSNPDLNLSSHPFTSSPLCSPFTAINVDSKSTTSSNGAAYRTNDEDADPENPTTLFRTKPFCLTNPNPEKTVLSQCSQSNKTSRSTESTMEQTLSQTENYVKSLTEKTNIEVNSAPAIAQGCTPPVPAAQITRGELDSKLPSNTLVRTKSYGHVQEVQHAQSEVPAVCTDATIHDRLWTKVEPHSHRDSLSSSSSISSSDTVIDLSLPNLARKGLSSLSTVSNIFDPHWVNCTHSAMDCHDSLHVKSKSNPNLRHSEIPQGEIKLQPSESPQEASMDLSSRETQRRHTWSQLYMEGLKQSSANRLSPAAISHMSAASMSKSLGDLTSDDISCNFESKYRSISQGFIIRPTREQHCKSSPRKSQPTENLTEQLRKLTNVEPLTASEFTEESRHRDSEEETLNETLVRRKSSRSQSRVRYIANRAKKAQERQRLQALIQDRHASFSLTSCPIEERENPEGACCVAPSPCATLDLCSQLTPLRILSQKQSCSSLEPENCEVFSMFKL